LSKYIDQDQHITTKPGHCHPVYIAKPFGMDSHRVTNSSWELPWSVSWNLSIVQTSEVWMVLGIEAPLDYYQTALCDFFRGQEEL